MTDAFRYVTYLAAAAVVVVLLMGLWNLAKGGSPNRSQQLMRARVMFQAVAIALLMLFLWISGR